jgi:hypothetical protein
MIHVFSNLEDLGDGERPFCDMAFEIVEKRYDEANSAWILVFEADAEPHKPVGYKAIIPDRGWNEQIDGDDEDAFHSFWGTMALESIGQKSDRLIALLADYYGIHTNSQKKRSIFNKIFDRDEDALETSWKFANHIECLAVGIKSNPAKIAEEPVRIKLFFEDSDENGPYAEVFLNIDMPSKLAELNEKDEGYRTDLIHWLSRQGNVNAISDVNRTS